MRQRRLNTCWSPCISLPYCCCRPLVTRAASTASGRAWSFDKPVINWSYRSAVTCACACQPCLRSRPRPTISPTYQPAPASTSTLPPALASLVNSVRARARAAVARSLRRGRPRNRLLIGRAIFWPFAWVKYARDRARLFNAAAASAPIVGAVPTATVAVRGSVAQRRSSGAAAARNQPRFIVAHGHQDFSTVTKTVLADWLAKHRAKPTGPKRGSQSLRYGKRV